MALSSHKHVYESVQSQEPVAHVVGSFVFFENCFVINSVFSLLIQNCLTFPISGPLITEYE